MPAVVWYARRTALVCLLGMQCEPKQASSVANARHSTSIAMSLGPLEIALIFLVILLVFGAKRIPEIARGLGKGIREFRDASNDIKKELTIGDTPQQQIRPPVQQPIPAPAQQAPAPAQQAPAPARQAPAPAPPPADPPADPPAEEVGE